ncbi:E3 ubiquitin-protein ligase TRIM39-like [Seriola dumerili]|uniref:E3 ubiquitin-protein ligase TRIM39-like n=1 Tax=Seriola dumerili TaxID=41447 RepID=UPI000BBE9CA8|nr:E3 ubiquitin-protein ligase TRIM39-like [Seriola dumerili]
MAAASCLLTEDQFLCSICLDVFTDPVTTPCGHNFCKNCITEHWDINVPCLCPVCKEVFYTRPELRVNTLISEMAAHSSELQRATSEDICCDICTGTKLKALKSCLVCLSSYCETHLEPHLTVTGLKKHQLISPVENLQGRMCMKHDKPLELFCKTDQTCVCMLCMVLDHRTHDVVPLKKEYEEKNAELEKTESEIQQMIQKRRLKIQEFKHSVNQSLAEFTEMIKDKQRPTKKQAEGLIIELEQEILDLMKRSNELEQLSCSEDHLQFLQSFLSLKDAPPTKDWTDISVRPPSYEGTVVTAVVELEKKLRKDIKNVFKVELKRVQQYAVDVTLDPETANPWLILSGDGKQVTFGDVNKNLQDSSSRFSYYASVLGKQSFTTGRFYYEVQVKGKSKWVLGVARESVNRKGQITLNPLNGYWTVSLRNGNEYKALADPCVHLSLKSKPEKVGGFVDYEEGLLSFYDVDAAALIYSFTGCSFTEKLYPFFNPCNNDGGKNSDPLVICPVRNIKVNLVRIYSRIRKNP